MQKIRDTYGGASKKTIAQIVADFENLESTLVELTDVAISKSSGASYSGTCTIKDASGMMDLYTELLHYLQMIISLLAM